MPEDCSKIFENSTSICGINFKSVDTSQTTIMTNMFKGLKNLEELDLSSFDTRSVEDMNGMFQDCNEQLWVNISSFTEYDRRPKRIYEMFHPEDQEPVNERWGSYISRVNKFLAENKYRIMYKTTYERYEEDYYITQGHYRDPVFQDPTIEEYNWEDEERKYTAETRCRDQALHDKAIEEIDRLDLPQIDNNEVTNLGSLNLDIDLNTNKLINKQLGEEVTEEICLNEVLNRINDEATGITNSEIDELSNEERLTSVLRQEAKNVRIEKRKNKDAKLRQAFGDNARTTEMHELKVNTKQKDPDGLMAANGESGIEGNAGRAEAVQTITTKNLSDTVEEGAENEAQLTVSDTAQQEARHQRPLPKRLDMKLTGDEVIMSMVSRLYREAIQPIARDVVSIVNEVTRKLTRCLGVIREWF